MGEKWIICKPCKGTGYKDRVWRGNDIPSAAPRCGVCGGRAWVKTND